MTKKLLFVTTILFVVAFVALAADVNGKWTYQRPGFNGGDPVAVTITLKNDGGTLTGSVPGMGRGGAPAEPVAISNAKVDGDHVYFEVKRYNRVVVRYQNVSGKELKIEAEGDLFCRAIQHEIDHLDGELFFDKAAVKLKADLELSKHGFLDGDVASMESELNGAIIPLTPEQERTAVRG